MVAAAAAAAAWGSARPLWMRLSASGSDCEVLKGTHRDRQRQERQAERENEAEMRRVRSPRAAAHLRRLLCHRSVGCGGGGRPPPNSLTALGHPHNVGTAESGWHPPAAHRHMRPLHVLEPGRLAEAGARVQASIVGFEPTFSTCSDARSSTTCCQRWAARRSALIAGRRKASAHQCSHAPQK